MVVERTVSISPDHPALPGHFPGHPVVPGVVLLSEVLDGLVEAMQEHVVVTELPVVKFLAPLKPGETLTLSIEPHTPGHADFRCHAGARLVASGSVNFKTVPWGKTGAR